MTKTTELQRLKKTIRNLRSKNAELSSTLKMIQSGQVDSLLVSSPLGERIFTLHMAEQPYHQLIESLNEGVITLSSEGLILFCNAKLQNILKTPYEKLIGSDIRAHIQPENRHTLEFILERSLVTPSRAQVKLSLPDRSCVSVQLSMSKTKINGVLGFSVVVTDLSHIKQNTVLFQQHEWLGKILNRLPVPMVLVEEEMQGFTFVNEKAKALLRDYDKNPDNVSFSFVNKNGQVYQLKELLVRVQTYGGKNGYETHLSLKDRKIPVLLFTESLPPIQDMRAARLLVFQDLTYLKKVQQDLSQALWGRDQFMSALSHELRTPLNVILGWMQLIRSNPNDHALVRQALETLERNAILQWDLIEDLLDMSRIVTGNLTLDKKPIDLKAMIEELIPLCQMKAAEKLVYLQVDLHKTPVVVMADPRRAHQLISHLIHNAIKFTHYEGHVKISLDYDQLSDCAVMEVKDDGEGIDPFFLPHVFEQFKQENMSTNRSYGGLGLGLAICKTIVGQHGGDICAYSEGRGKGATFTVRLPLALRSKAAKVVAPATVSQSAREVDLHGLRVLVVDDSKDNLVLFTIWLKNSGAEILTMESASGVIEAIHKFRPHVLLSDISMPGEDGYSLIAKVRSMSPQNGGLIPAGAITANARTEDRDLSIAAGYHMHIPKPVTAFNLAKAVKSLSEMTPIH